MEPDDAQAVVERLRRGDPAALALVFAAWRARLYSFLVRLTGRTEVAEDLLQETFLQLARHGRSLAPDTRLDAWLFTVARHLATSHWRRQRHRPEARGERDVADPAARSPFEAIAAAETQRRLERALAALPESLREALLLVAVEGFDAANAAAILGVRPEALRQRVHRARELVARELEREEPS